MQSRNCVCKLKFRFEALNILMQVISGGESFLLMSSAIAAAVILLDDDMIILWTYKTKQV